MIFNYWLQQNNNAIVAKSINRKKHQHSKTLVVLPMTFVFFCLETKEKKQKKNSRL